MKKTEVKYELNSIKESIKRINKEIESMKHGVKSLYDRIEILQNVDISEVETEQKYVLVSIGKDSKSPTLFYCRNYNDWFRDIGDADKFNLSFAEHIENEGIRPNKYYTFAVVMKLEDAISKYGSGN